MRGTNTDLESIRRAQIITAAISKISEVGIAGVTMDDIAAAAGLSKGGIAHYFSSKDELFKSAFKEFFTRIFRRSKATMERHAAPLQKLLSFDWLYDEGDPDVGVGYPLLFDFMSLAVRDRECREIFQWWVNGWIDLLREAIVEGQARGMFTGLDPESTARTISSIYQGIAERWYIDRESQTTEWAVKSYTESITRLLGV